MKANGIGRGTEKKKQTECRIGARASERDLHESLSSTPPPPQQFILFAYFRFLFRKSQSELQDVSCAGRGSQFTTTVLFLFIQFYALDTVRGRFPFEHISHFISFCFLFFFLPSMLFFRNFVHACRSCRLIFRCRHQISYFVFIFSSSTSFVSTRLRLPLWSVHFIQCTRRFRLLL